MGGYKAENLLFEKKKYHIYLYCKTADILFAVYETF